MTATPPTPADGNPAGRFFGILLMIAGVLIAGLSGLCTLGFGAVMMSESGHSGADSLGAMSGGIVVLMIFGGIPFAFGVASILVGRFLYRASRPKLPNLTKTFE